MCQVYPNNCGKLFDTTTHVLRATFSGGVTTDGIASIMPSNKNIFKITKQDSSPLDYLGLADLGQNLGEDALTDYDYEQVDKFCIELNIILIRMGTTMLISAWICPTIKTFLMKVWVWRCCVMKHWRSLFSIHQRENHMVAGTRK